ncbi:hypothetical protein U1Q18_038890 [Sarracenia purpurea var. burkii]
MDLQRRSLSSRLSYRLPCIGFPLWCFPSCEPPQLLSKLLSSPLWVVWWVAAIASFKSIGVALLSWKVLHLCFDWEVYCCHGEKIYAPDLCFICAPDLLSCQKLLWYFGLVLRGHWVIVL